MGREMLYDQMSSSSCLRSLKDELSQTNKPDGGARTNNNHCSAVQDSVERTTRSALCELSLRLASHG